MSDDEQRRVRSRYASYASSAAKQRSWAAENPGNAAIRAELVEAVFAVAGSQLGRASELLDVGCGGGWWLEELSGRGVVSGSLHGVDLLDERIAAARERVPDASLQVADARRLPYGDGRFGAVTMFTTLSSLASRGDAVRALAEARRVLAPGGVLIIWEPRFPNPLNRATMLISRRLLDRALAGMRIERTTTTLLPPLARRLGLGTTRLYPALVRVAPLRSHRVTAATRLS